MSTGMETDASSFSRLMFWRIRCAHSAGCSTGGGNVKRGWLNPFRNPTERELLHRVLRRTSGGGETSPLAEPPRERTTGGLRTGGPLDQGLTEAQACPISIT